MCFASAPSASQAARPATDNDYEFVDGTGSVVPEGTGDAVRRLKARQYASSILFSGNDGSADAAGTSDGPSSEGGSSGTW